MVVDTPPPPPLQSLRGVFRHLMPPWISSSLCMETAPLFARVGIAVHRAVPERRTANLRGEREETDRANEQKRNPLPAAFTRRDRGTSAHTACKLYRHSCPSYSDMVRRDLFRLLFKLSMQVSIYHIGMMLQFGFIIFGTGFVPGANLNVVPILSLHLESTRLCSQLIRRPFEINESARAPTYCNILGQITIT